jgi:hypothetical protein
MASLTSIKGVFSLPKKKKDYILYIYIKKNPEMIEEREQSSSNVENTR